MAVEFTATEPTNPDDPLWEPSPDLVTYCLPPQDFGLELFIGAIDPIAKTMPLIGLQSGGTALKFCNESRFMRAWVTDFGGEIQVPFTGGSYSATEVIDLSTEPDELGRRGRVGSQTFEFHVTFTPGNAGVWLAPGTPNCPE
jgi:hypothetical protein